MKKIIVPIDFSKCSIQALKAAAKIAKKSGATIFLYHCYDRPVYGFVDLTLDSRKNNEIMESINKEIDALAGKKYLKGISVKKVILPDVFIQDLYDLKGVKGADLIVMGSHGARGWKNEMMGSNAEKFVRFSDVPVLVIKEHTDFFKMKKIVFASDFSKKVEPVFAKIKKISSLFNSKVALLSVVTPSNFQSTPECMDQMEKFARKFSLANYSKNIFNSETIEDGVLAFAKQNNADVITLGTHGRTGFSQLLVGSVAEDITNHAKRPILSVKI